MLGSASLCRFSAPPALFAAAQARALVTAACCLTLLLSQPVGAQWDKAREIREYDPVIEMTTDRLEMILQHDPACRLEITTVYLGAQPASPPTRVELVLMRDLTDVRERAELRNDVRLVVDGERYERAGTLNVRNVGRPDTRAMALVFPFDVFERLARATSIAGSAFGLDFELTPAQLVALQTVAERWRHSSP